MTCPPKVKVRLRKTNFGGQVVAYGTFFICLPIGRFFTAPSPYGVLIFKSSLRSALCRLAQKCILRRRWIFLCIGAVHVCKSPCIHCPCSRGADFSISIPHGKAPCNQRLQSYLLSFAACADFCSCLYNARIFVVIISRGKALSADSYSCAKKLSSQNRHCENMTVPEVLCRRYNIFPLSIARL